ncbi:T9SS type A sorting domain-containing protein [Spirosoma koreense]
MKQLFLLTYAFLWMVLGATLSWAQCPATESYVTSTTVASCPSNGVIQLTNPADVPVNGGQGVAGAIYTITAGPASGGYQTTGQSANRFEGLPPGTYSVTISKPGCTNVVKSTIVIASTYTPISLTATVTDQCTGGQPGGTITASSTGGTAPIEYAFIQAPSANVDEALLTYGPASTTTTTSFGTFQVRARDACGVFTTQTVNIQPNTVKAYFNPTGSAKDCDTYAISGSLNPVAGGASLTPNPANPYTIELFDVATTNPCGIPSGAAPFQTITASSPADLRFDLDKTHGLLAIRTTSPCGEVEVRCYNLSSTFGPTLSRIVSPSCEITNGTNGVDMLLQPGRFTAPLQVTITSQGPGNPVLTTDQLPNNNAKLYALPYVAEGYAVSVEDACGQVRSFTLATPPTGASPVGVSVSTSLGCADALGSKRTTITLSGGATGLLEAGSSVVLTAGPEGSIAPARPADGSSNSGTAYYWNNLAPGVYTGQLEPKDNTCGPTSFTFTVPQNSPTSPGLNYSLTGSVATLCSGNASLSTSFNYNGGTPVTYQLRNAANQLIATNTTGFFTELAPDVYTVTASASTGCGVSLSQTQSFTLPVSDTTPRITKKVGIVCESGGTPASSGQAFFAFSGLAPYRLEVSPAGGANWSTIATGISSNTFAVSNLAANGTYDFRLSDNCGKSTVTTVSIKSLEAQQVENRDEPCAGQPYTLSAPEYPGASYRWTKDGSLISTDRQVVFNPFQASDNGVYEVTITLGGGCVVRTARVTLNSSNCGQELPVHLVSFQAKVLAGQSVQLDWVTAWEKDNAFFQVQRSKDLAGFETIGQVAAGEGKSQGTTYQYVDHQPYGGTSYYRLVQVDQGGMLTTYPAVAVVLRTETYGVYPNPVIDARFTLSLDEPESARIQLYSGDGRRLAVERRVLSTSQVELTVSQKLAVGTYLLVVEERAQKRTYHLIVQK